MKRLNAVLVTMLVAGFVFVPLQYQLMPAQAAAHAADRAMLQENERSFDDDNGNGIPDEMEDWETPYEPSQDLITAFTEAEESGSCWEVMNSKLDLFLAETRYWSGVAEPGSQGKRVISKVLDLMLDLQLGMAKNRLDLEKKSGESDKCEANSKLTYLNDPLEDLKLKMRKAGWLIDTGDSIEITEEVATKRCSAAASDIKLLGKRIDNLTDKLAERAEDGDLDDVSNAKELLNMARETYGNASALKAESKDAADEESQARLCVGARDEANLGLSLFTRAKKFNKGTREDKSDPAAEVDAKIKMFLGVIAQKRFEALARSSEKRGAILSALASAEEAIVDVQVEFAKVKYDEDVDAGDFDEQLEEIKADFKPVIDALENAEEQDLSKKKRLKSSKKLLTKARKEIKSLNTRLNKKENKANTDAEEDILQFVEQTSKVDAANARKAAQAYKRTKKYANAQLQALEALHTAKLAKEMLKEVQ